MKSALPIVLLGLAGVGAIVVLNKKASAVTTSTKPTTSVDKLTSKAQSKVAPIQAKAQSYADKARSEAQSLAAKLKVLGV
jgi:hypothetical protein